ncbi:MAG: hypothetical protein ACKO3W_07555, partial [bacterium]
REFVGKWKNGVETPEGLDFPLIEDMVESLRAHASDVAQFDAFVAQWIYGTKLPDLELGESTVTLDAAGSTADAKFIVEGTLRNRSKNGGEVQNESEFEIENEIEVVVRAYGEAPDSELDPDANADGKTAPTAPFEDIIVRLKGNEQTAFRIVTTFRPVKVVVDPEVRLLFVGRKRCESSL